MKRNGVRVDGPILSQRKNALGDEAIDDDAAAGAEADDGDAGTLGARAAALAGYSSGDGGGDDRDRGGDGGGGATLDAKLQQTASRWSHESPGSERSG